MRDFGFRIYKTLHAAPEKAKEDKHKDDKKDKDKRGDDKKSDKDDKKDNEERKDDKKDSSKEDKDADSEVNKQKINDLDMQCSPRLCYHLFHQVKLIVVICQRDASCLLTCIFNILPNPIIISLHIGSFTQLNLPFINMQWYSVIYGCW